MASRWTNEGLEAVRQIGDPEADALVARVLNARPGDGTIGRGGYNHLLDVANVLVSHPELSLVRESLLRRRLDEAGDVAAFFDPIEAPAWVDEAKLARATAIWETDAILAIAVLYAASLPACYLMVRGVPALYRTEKLAEHKYVFQRIYETGLMLEAVMSRGGITVARDVEPSADQVIADVLNEADPSGQWAWEHHRLHRRAGEGGRVDAAAVRTAVTRAHGQARRFVWGRGFIAARKVRFLHASMRYMLQNPDAMRQRSSQAAPGRPHSFMEHATHRAQPWDTPSLGVPINQEDLAFVLLTFGYLIPKGMEVWGRKVSREDKEAFLHLWRVVGHAMGIRDDLMTDRLDEAEALYEQILRKNGGESEPGRILTDAEMAFLRSYLPNRLGMARFVPASLIIDQLGREWASKIVPEAGMRASRGLMARVIHGAAKLGVRKYYWLRRRVLRFVPIVGPAVTSLTNHAADTLIDSWRDSFRRRPFYVPGNATTWVAERGVTPEFEATLMAWRQRLFDTVAASLGGIVLSGLAFAATIAFFLLEMPAERDIAFWTSLGALVLGMGLLRYGVPSVARQRPVLRDHA